MDDYDSLSSLCEFFEGFVFDAGKNVNLNP